MNRSLPDLESQWFPVAAGDDLPRHHVYAGQLAGHELAIWRADDGHVNVWEDRCVHRGVRLSVGRNDGAELTCQYHGWRYANRTGGCTYIPAHPADAPAQTICVRSFPGVERYGLVWSSIRPHTDVPTVNALAGGAVVALRALPFDAAPEHVLERLAAHRFAPTGDVVGSADAVMTSSLIPGVGVILTATTDIDSSTAVFFVQPVDADRTFVRPVLIAPATGSIGVDVLIHHADALDDLRTTIEAEAGALERPQKLTPPFIPLAEPADAPRDARAAPVRTRVAAKYQTAAGIVALELEPISGELPSFQPGAHVDVHLPNGLVRQYSLTNGPDETGIYRIGVKLAEPSNGGSAWIHEHIRAGDLLAISEPHNNFTLRRDALQTILIAGGIGVTPLLAMAKTIARSGLGWTMHYFAQGAQHVAFRSDLDRLGDDVVLHVGLDPQATTAELRRILSTPAEFVHVYICGPAPMLDAARRVAGERGWPDPSIHFEYFENTTAVSDTSEFEISLARSALTLPVQAGETILEVLRANGVQMASSCEQGACGTCLVRVIDGVPDHQDVYMSDAEHAAGDRIANVHLAVAHEQVDPGHLMITLYDYILSVNCYKVRLLMSILDVDYVSVPIDFYPGWEHKGAAFKKINRLGHIPVIDDDGFVMRDSHAILVYLAAKYDPSRQWYPIDDARLLGETASWLLFAEGTTSTASAARLHVNLGYDFDLAAVQAGAHRLFRVLDEHLWLQEHRDLAWVTSGANPTIADLAIFPDVVLSEEGGISRRDYPSLRRWTERVQRVAGFVPMPGIFTVAPE